MNAEGWFLLGAPWDCSGSGRGERMAPQALRAAGLSALVSADRGDAACGFDDRHRDEATGIVALAATLAAAEALAEALDKGLRELPGRRPLVIGGDCSILFGIIPALRRQVGSVGLWFLDGHPDYLDGATSDTGETADMDLAVLTGVGAQPLTGLGGAPPMVEEAEVVLIGHRTNGLDKDAAGELARVPAGLRRIDATAVVADPAAAGARAAAWLAGAGDGVWLHLDVDVLDPRSLPAVTYPQPSGPGWEHLEAVLEPLARSPRLLGMSVADFRPDLDSDGALARRLVQLVDRTL